MYKPIEVKEVKIIRDCEDFTGKPGVPHCCLFSDSCTGPINQGMFVDSYYNFRGGRDYCTGVCDASKLPLLEKICTGKPVKISQDEVDKLDRQHAETYIRAVENTKNLIYDFDDD
jgi:hypothetical protein